AFPAKSTSRRVFFKFNYNISDNHRLMHGYHNDYWSFPGVPSAVTAPSTVNIGHGDNPTPNLVYTGVLSSKTFVEARLAGYYGKDSTDPLIEGEPRVLPRITNNDTGQITGGISSWGDAKTWRTGASGKISHLADRFLGGSHDVKLGIQYSGGGRDAIFGTNDYLYIVGGKQSYGYTRLPYHSGGLIRSVGAYAVTPSGGRTNFSVVSSNANLAIDRGYSDPHSHEAIVQVEQELANNLGLQVNYVYKRGYDYPGWQDIGGQYAQVPYVDSVGVEASGRTMSVFRLISPFSQSVLQMTNEPGL